MISNEGLQLIDFHATWCMPCRVLMPIIDEVKETIGDKVNVVKVDIDNNRILSAKHNVRSVPTLMLFKDGEVVWRQSGVLSVKQIINVINSHL